MIGRNQSGADLETSIATMERGAPAIPDPCFKCVYFRGILLHGTNDVQEADADVYCKAFPDGIPAVIQNGRNDHSRPLAGQKNKIVFKERL